MDVSEVYDPIPRPVDRGTVSILRWSRRGIFRDSPDLSNAEYPDDSSSRNTVKNTIREMNQWMDGWMGWDDVMQN
jgi:hypothetical protein